MAERELTARELKQNLTQAKKDAEAIAKSSKTIKDSLADAAKSLTKFGGITNFGNSVATGILGQRGMGYGVPGGMPGPAQLQSSLYRTGVGLTDFTNFASGMAKGVGNFLPEVASTIQRAGTYYNATIMGGFRGSQRISRGDVENATFGTLAQMSGITSSGSSAMVANILANQGMVAGSDVYARTVRSVGNAARYLNMSNESAAAAIGGLGTGVMSANLMRNFGIYTTDPVTGKERSMSDVFEELANRITKPGTNPTAEDVQNSIRKGALGAVIASSGLSGEQQTLFKQYMIERASGNKMDLSDQSEMKKLMDSQNLPGPGSGIMAMNDNPLNAMMDLETSAEGAEKAATPAYILGIKTATGTLKGLDLVAGTLAKTLGLVTSNLQTVLGARTVSGLTGMAGASLDLISSGLKALMEADPTKISMAIPGGLAVGVGTGGLAAAGATYGTGNVFGNFLNLSGADAGGKPKGDSPDSAMNAELLGNLDKGFSIGKASADIGQALAGKLSIVGYDFNEKTDRGRTHDGIDYKAKLDQEVYATAAGKVVEVKDGLKPSVGSGKKLEYTGGEYGNYVKIEHGLSKNGKTIYTVYAHLNKVASGIKAGKEVKKGELIGYAGRTGLADGVHLHYEVKEGGVAVDPRKLRSILPSQAGKSFQVSAQQMSQIGNIYQGLQALFSGDVAGGLSKLGSAFPSLGITGDIGSKYGLSGGTSPGMSVSNNGASPAPGGVVNNVGGITVNIKDSSPEAAKKFAQYVKEYLENDTLTSNLGSY